MAFKAWAHASQPLPKLIDNTAKSDPDRLWAKCPVAQQDNFDSADTNLLYRSITYRQFAHAIDHLAYMLRDSLGEAQGFETIAYMGPTDIRYSIVVVAAMKTGYKTFLPSPRNSKIAFQTLMAELDCRVLLTTDPEPACVSVLSQGYKLVKLVVPDAEALLACPGSREYPYSKSFDKGKSDPVLVLHTSGTTGIPTPVIYTNEFITRSAMVLSLAATSEETYSLNSLYNAGSIYCMLPPYHIAGITCTIFFPAYLHSVPIYPVTDALPTMAGLINTLHHVNADTAFLPPSFISDLAQNKSQLEYVSSKLKFLLFGGGSVSQSIGDMVSLSMPLYSLLGSSECGAIPLIRPHNGNLSKDWNFARVHPLAEVEFRHRFDNMYEMIFVRRPETECYQPVFALFPHLHEYHTKDLFTPHPIEQDMWTHRGRMDDIIVLLNGEKSNPIPFENHVSCHPEIQSALLAGSQRNETALLVELKDRSVALTHQTQAAVIDRLWPIIQEANMACPAYAKISKARVLLTDPSKPMARSAKGTVQRQATWKLYASELDALYCDKGLSNSSGGTQQSMFKDPEAVISQIITDVTQWEQVDSNLDLFFQGMDSLQISQIGRRIQSEFQISSLPEDTFYANPTVSLLAKAIPATASKSHPAPPKRGERRLEAMQRYLDRYVEKIDAITPGIRPRTPHPTTSTYQTVVLTGSTGALGSYILDQLLQTPSVNHIYCLNRSADSASLQKTRNTARNLLCTFPASLVTFVNNVDFSQPHLNLDPGVYSQIQSTATHIIHNAWPVDYMQHLRSFEPSLDGVLNLITLAANSPRRPCLFFISSLFAVVNYPAIDKPCSLVPEGVIPDMRCTMFGGYGESKYLAERMLDHAARQLHIKTVSCRLGQVAGSTCEASSWGSHEWFPRLVVSSRYLGALPNSLGGASSNNDENSRALLTWMPIDQVARVLIELAFVVTASPSPGPPTPGQSDQNDNGLVVFHPIHPRPFTWEDMHVVIREALTEDSRDDVEIVPDMEWISRLEKSAAAISKVTSTATAKQLLRSNPGVKLLDFYKMWMKGKFAFTRLDTVRTLAASETLRQTERLRPEWLTGWAKSWLDVRACNL